MGRKENKIRNMIIIYKASIQILVGIQFIKENKEKLSKKISTIILKKLIYHLKEPLQSITFQ
jgi:hypothetical protein